jgi:hypothetical protein
MRSAGVVALVLAPLLTACASDSGPRAARVTEGRVSSDGPVGPPPLTLRRPEGIVDLDAWSWCTAAGCSTGERPDHPAVTTAAGHVAFFFPLAGWVFDAAFAYPGAGHCGRTAHEPLEAGPDGTYDVAAPGAVGTWDVAVTGYSDEGGYLSAEFRWTTAASDPGTEAVGDLVWLWPRRGVTSPPTLSLRGLADDPLRAEAELTLPGHPGIPPYRLHQASDDCPGSGALTLVPDGSLVGSTLVPQLRDTERVEVHLFFDDDEYVGTATWPDDYLTHGSAQLRLTWEPALPAWDGSP